MSNIALIAVFLTFIGMASAGFISYGGMDNKVAANSEGQKALWSKVNSVNDKVTTYDAIIPIMRYDLQEIKNDQKMMNQTMQQILVEVKK